MKGGIRKEKEYEKGIGYERGNMKGDRIGEKRLIQKVRLEKKRIRKGR